MATPVTSSNWVISFGRKSFTDQETYTISLPDDIEEAVVKNLARRIEELGFLNVRYDLRIVLQ